MALPLLVSELPAIKKLNINRISLIIGSLLPDLIDKPLLLLGLGSGRLISHNLLFILISFIICFLFSKRELRISLPFLTGLLIHIILDLPDVPLFYPFISYNLVYPEEPFFLWFTALISEPIVIITELTGVGILIFIVINNKLYHWSAINEYLKGNYNATIIK